MLPFCCLPGNQSDKPRGLRGRAPSFSPNGGSKETENTMAKNTHLTLSDRIAVEVGLREQKSFSAIAAELGKDPTTISKEVRAHIKLKQAGGYNPCVIRKDCKHYGDLCNPCKFTYGKSCSNCFKAKCFESCPDFQRAQCSKLNSRPMSATGASSARSASWSDIFMKQNLHRRNTKRPEVNPGRALR